MFDLKDKFMFLRKLYLQNKIRKIFFFVLISLVGAALLKSFFAAPLNKMEDSDNLTALHDNWQESKTKEQEKLLCEYRYQIPAESERDLVLAVENYLYSIQVLLDDQEIYSYEDIYRERGINILWIPLPQDAAGQNLTIRLKNSSSDNPSILAFLGGADTLFLKYIKDNLYAVFFGSIFFLIGCAVVLVSHVFSRYLLDATRRTFLYLGIFIFLVGIWIVTDSDILQIFTGKTGFTTFLSFFSFMIMPYYFLKFFCEVLTHKKRSIVILSRCFLFQTFFCTFTYLFRIFNLYQTLLITHILIVLSIIMVLKVGIWEIQNYRNLEMKKIIAGITGFIFFCVIALILFYIRPVSIYSAFYGLGIFFLISCLLSASLGSLYSHLNRNASAEVYRRLAYTDTMTHLKNRSAFIQYQESAVFQKNRGCIVFDINNLKQINDRYGHQKGDQMIVLAAKCIQDIFEKLGHCYRIGGDEFVVLLENVSEKIIVENLAKLDFVLSQINAAADFPLELAYGYSFHKKSKNSVSQLFSEADEKMYQKKQAMKSPFHNTDRFFIS